MINASFKKYDYYRYDTTNGYGERTLPTVPTGQISLSIHLNTQNRADNINYKDVQYIALTLDNSVREDYVIAYGNIRLKVLYINPSGRYIQVLLAEMK